MFDDIFNNITTRSDLTDATVEIIIMLLVAFILGFILRQILGCKPKHDVTDHHKSQPEPVISSPPTTLDPETKTEVKIEATTSDVKPEDLQLVEGIGPKIEGLLHAGGILTMEQLATVNSRVIQKILDAAGPRYAMHDPKTWSIQADLIEDKKWIELSEYQDNLTGGRDL